jgi:hypothetical protein
LHAAAVRVLGIVSNKIGKNYTDNGQQKAEPAVPTGVDIWQ